MAGLTYEHPFCDRQGRVVTADYVTLEDGTGLVHTAPGHGAEDYQQRARTSTRTAQYWVMAPTTTPSLSGWLGC